MKISDVQDIPGRRAPDEFIFFKLQTDTGNEGLGEATVEWNERAVVAALEELGEFLIGKDPFRTDYLISTMHRNWYWCTGVVFRSALSGAAGSAARY